MVYNGNERKDNMSKPNKTKIENTLKKCREGSMVAFKTFGVKGWYTGMVQMLYPPNGKYNISNTWEISIVSNQEDTRGIDGTKHVFYFEDIFEIKLLEK